MSDDSWQQGIYDVFKQSDIRLIGYVPDAGHAELINSAKSDQTMRDVVMTTEEEGIPLCAGAWLGGMRSVLLMQSSGVGNCVNMLSLQNTARFPMVIVVTMRGEYAEFNPWQIPMGSTTEEVLEICGFKVERVDDETEAAETVQAAIDFAYNSNVGVAVLLSQKLIGRKEWVK
ncbi:MAG: phosphonopyruvate decarboxylase [Gammaproteobacteria bacterium]|nr:phosphonopyruvate decarboxylase [Gammaproteobacteria bacterium]